jgi:hypothetical protein
MCNDKWAAFITSENMINGKEKWNIFFIFFCNLKGNVFQAVQRAKGEGGN